MRREAARQRRPPAVTSVRPAGHESARRTQGHAVVDANGAALQSFSSKIEDPIRLFPARRRRARQAGASAANGGRLTPSALGSRANEAAKPWWAPVASAQCSAAWMSATKIWIFCVCVIWGLCHHARSEIRAPFGRRAVAASAARSLAIRDAGATEAARSTRRGCLRQALEALHAGVAADTAAEWSAPTQCSLYVSVATVVDREIARTFGGRSLIACARAGGLQGVCGGLTARS